LKINFEEIETLEDTSELSEKIEAILFKIMQKLVPEKYVKKKLKENLISLRLENIKQKKRNLWKKAKRKKSEKLFKRCNDLDKNIRIIIKQETRNAVRNKIKPNDSKSLWKAVNEELGKEFLDLPPKVEYKGKLVEKDCHKAEIFSQFFKDKVNDTISQTSIDIENVFNGQCQIQNNNQNEYFTIKDIVKILDETKDKKSSGPDEIPQCVLRDGCQILAPVLTNLLNKIWKSESIPKNWKVSRVLPLHKKGQKKDVTNYRPISNISSTAKVFEKALASKIAELEIMNTVDLTGENQHGFKKHHSTQTATLEIQAKLADILEQKEKAAVVSLDLSAAFDLVDIELLIKRLDILGIPSKLLNLISNWLNERTAYVEVNSAKSTIFQLNRGTVQGSVLGPTLFALFIRPIYELIECIITYADDNYIIGQGKTDEEALQSAVGIATQVAEWLSKSGMCVNSSKTEVCLFSREETIAHEVTFLNETIKVKKEMKILGIVFDQKLTWEKQVMNATKNARKATQALSLIANNFTTKERVMVATSNVYSVMYYCAAVWLSKSLSNKCQRQLKRTSAECLRICLGKKRRELSYDKLHKEANRATPEMWGNYCTAIAMYDNVTIEKNTLIRAGLHFSHLNQQRSASGMLFTAINTTPAGSNAFHNKLKHVSNELNKYNWLIFSRASFKVLAKNIFINEEMKKL
jgi:Reverse transcriptase (RNA-dependent DNA polymerase)